MNALQNNTFASKLTLGLGGNSTSVAFKMVLFSRIAVCDILWPNGWRNRNITKAKIKRVFCYHYKRNMTHTNILIDLSSKLLREKRPWKIIWHSFLFQNKLLGILKSCNFNKMHTLLTNILKHRQCMYWKIFW